MFQNCTRFGLVVIGDSIVFEVNCECCDSLLFPLWNLKLSPLNHRIILDSMNQLIDSVDSINRLIEIVLIENQSSLDIAYPLCHIIYRENRETPSHLIKSYIECENEISNYAESYSSSRNTSGAITLQPHSLVINGDEVTAKEVEAVEIF
jgi:hypothetical protein